jgi:predicted transcriptional regulator
MNDNGSHARKRPEGRTRQLVRNRKLKGWTNARIARALGVSHQAVSAHVKRLVADGDLDA